jgi:hypothetical protein
MSRELNREELERDPYLAACLRAAEGDAPMDEVDWAALRGSIEARAELPLARLRKRHRPARWRRPVVSLAAAAALAAVALVGGLDRGPAPAPVQTGTVAVTPGVSIEEAMRSDLSDQEFGLVASGRTNADALLQIAAASD